MSSFCPTLSGDPALLFVGEAQSRFLNFAERSYDLAIEQNAALGNFQATPINFSVSFDFNDQLTPFIRPTAPSVDRREFTLPIGNAPLAPADFEPQNLELVPVPEYDLTTPVLVYGDRPTQPDIVAPTAPPRPETLTLPATPVYALPDVPTFESLNLPSAPTVVIESFGGQRPEFVEPPLNENWTFTPAEYASDLRNALEAKVSAWLTDPSALPASIQNALFDRGRSEIEQEAEADIAQAYDEFAARGFSQPPGMLAARVDRRRQAAQDRKAVYNREVKIEAFREALANMRLALQQGLALEQLGVNIHLEEQRLLLQSAQFQRETAVAILNARITVFNARLEAYRTDAGVFEQRIRAELAKVEVYRAQIEGERARGEINEQRTRIYAEQIRAVGVLADVYRTQVESVKVQADAQRSIIERYRAEVEAYGTRWEAYKVEWDGYRSAVEAENTKATVHRNLVDAFGLRVQAANTQNRTLNEREQLRIAQWTQDVESYRAKISGYQAQLEAERARLQALVQGVQAETTLYGARADVEQAASAATDRSFQLGLERARANVDTQLKRAEVLIQQNLQLLSLVLENLRTRATVSGQLAASSMSAVNASSSVSSGRSESKSCSQSLSYSGEAGDLE